MSHNRPDILALLSYDHYQRLAGPPYHSDSSTFTSLRLPPLPSPLRSLPSLPPSSSVLPGSPFLSPTCHYSSSPSSFILSLHPSVIYLACSSLALLPTPGLCLPFLQSSCLHRLLVPPLLPAAFSLPFPSTTPPWHSRLLPASHAPLPLLRPLQTRPLTYRPADQGKKSCLLSSVV